MQHNKLYQRAAGINPEQKVETPEAEASRQLLKEQKIKWLQQPETKDLILFLQVEAGITLDSAIDAANAGDEKVAVRRLIKLKTLKEITEYATGN
jgi:hypothetical protein